MKYKIGIFGSATKEPDEICRKAADLGKEICKKGDAIIIITGACDGLPYQVASIVARSGVEVWGYSPAKDLEGQKKFTPDNDLSIYKKLIYTPESFEFSSNIDVSKKYRNVASIANCDAGIIVGGRWGTMNEFTNLHDFGKVIGVLLGSGGIADELKTLYPKINKETKAKVIFNDNPEYLLKEVIGALK